MTSPGTIKSIQKRIYTVVASSTSTSTSTSTTTSSSSSTRVRSNSLSRNLYTSPNQNLSFFDSPPPPPPPSSRPGNPHVLSTSRLPIKGDGSGSGSGEGQGQHHHTQNTSTGPFSLALSSSPNPNSSSQSHYIPPGSSTYYTQGHPFFPYNTAFAPVPFYSARADKEKQQQLGKKQRYQLDVGAYGIAKRRGGSNMWGKGEGGDDLSLAVQVGEDAYFIRDNAMGVADGVGGWARHSSDSAAKPTAQEPSPSALFARRLMNFCSVETEAATSPSTSFSSIYQPPSYSPTSFSFPSNPTTSSPYRPTPTPWPWSQSPSPSQHFNTPSSYHEPPHKYNDEILDPSEDMDPTELEEFKEGLDVLMILERAYESAIKAHVVPSPQSTPDMSVNPNEAPKSNGTSIPIPIPRPSSAHSQSASASPASHIQPLHSTSAPHPNTHTHSNPNPTSAASNANSSKTTTPPLLQGSSTALLAVLDHSPPSSHSNSPHQRSRPQTASSSSPSPAQGASNASGQTTRQSSRTLPTSKSKSPSSAPSLKNLCPAPLRSSSPSKTPSSNGEDPTTAVDLIDRLNEKVTGGSGAVLKIAHLGDCMGMLVRGEEIVWRSEEMWWSFNTPVQLGPLSPSKPSTHARTFTLPIEQDDILILASDGLSDNLWDEEVLDEVVRMRSSFLPISSGATTPSASPPLADEKEKEGSNGRSTSPIPTTSLLGRRTLAGMLSEALCSRARRVSERRPRSTTNSKFSCEPAAVDDEVPFGRRAREQGRAFRGGKVDDISVVVAVISPADVPKSQTQTV